MSNGYAPVSNGYSIASVAASFAPQPINSTPPFAADIDVDNELAFRRKRTPVSIWSGAAAAIGGIAFRAMRYSAHAEAAALTAALAAPTVEAPRPTPAAEPTPVAAVQPTRRPPQHLSPTPPPPTTAGSTTTPRRR